MIEAILTDGDASETAETETSEASTS